MVYIDEVELDYNIREQILPVLGDLHDEPEMDESQSAFLCGLILKYRPKAVLEVGIAGGGTTAIIMKALKTYGLDDAKLMSVDYLEQFYADNTLQSGFLGVKAKRLIGFRDNCFDLYLGNVACSFVHQADSFDLVIIDTVHSLPGELLDFITLLPYMHEGTIVAVHDITLPYVSPVGENSYATTVLFSAVCGDKYLNTIENNKKLDNIGAFVVTKDTYNYIENLFLSLLVKWNYVPDDKQLTEYRSNIEKNYSSDLLSIFDTAVQFNKRGYEFVSPVMRWVFPFNLVPINSKIVLYGAGDVGKCFYAQLKKTKYCDIALWVDRKIDISTNIKPIEEICNCCFDYIVIAISSEEISNDVCLALQELGVKKDLIIWANYKM